VHCSLGLALHTGHRTDSIRFNVSCPVFTSTVFNVAALRDMVNPAFSFDSHDSATCCEIALINPVPEGFTELRNGTDETQVV
jgi:hypothetical protein